MAEADLSDLVREAEATAAELERPGDLPKIERSLKQVLEATNALYSKLTAAGGQDVQANLLLGTRGFDLSQVTQKLEYLSTVRTFEPRDPVPPTDVQNYLKNESENAILQLIESTDNSTFNHVEALHFSNITDEWRNLKIDLMNSSLGYTREMVDLPKNEHVSIMNESLFRPSSLEQEQMAYVKCLTEYNNNALQGVPVNINLVETFAKASESSKNRKLSDMWKMLNCMTQLTPVGKSDPLTARADPKVQDEMRHQGLVYLEQRYTEYMVALVNTNMVKARRGGAPGTIPLVKGFVEVKLTSRNGLEVVDGRPLWPLVYFCIRCGDIEAAVQCLRAGQAYGDIAEMLEQLKNSRNRRLETRMELQVSKMYRSSVRASSDPYKRVVYCVLGACDVDEDHSTVCNTADDYLWLRLWQIREEKEEPVSDSIYYSRLQHLILEKYEEQSFKAVEQPHVYFQMFVLTGQWESAIGFLFEIDCYRSHAIHMAIALHELDLLALPANINSPLLVIDPGDRRPMRRLNLFRFLILYTNSFKKSDPLEALHYFYVLRKLPGNGGHSNAFATCVVEYVIDTKQYDLILGYLQNDGCRHRGLLDNFEGSYVNVRDITEVIAQTAESKGLIEDAIKLYDLCEIHEKALSLLNSMLSQVLSRPTTDPNSLRDRLKKFVFEFNARNSAKELNCQSITLTTFQLLERLIHFFDSYQRKEYNKALNEIQVCKILPFNANEVDQRVNSFKLLEDAISRNIPDILLVTMTIYYHQYQQIMGDSNASYSQLEDTERTKQLQFIRERAKLLTSFAGTIPYRLPGDTNSRLVQLEIGMT